MDYKVGEKVLFLAPEELYERTGYKNLQNNIVTISEVYKRFNGDVCYEIKETHQHVCRWTKRVLKRIDVKLGEI